MSSALHIETAFKAMVMFVALAFLITEFYLAAWFLGGSLSFSGFVRNTAIWGGMYLASPFLVTAAIWVWAQIDPAASRF